jgi:hypothetical protein
MEKQDIDENTKNHGKTGAAGKCPIGLFVPWTKTFPGTFLHPEITS